MFLELTQTQKCHLTKALFERPFFQKSLQLKKTKKYREYKKLLTFEIVMLTKTMTRDFQQILFWNEDGEQLVTNMKELILFEGNKQTNSNQYNYAIMTA